jgi:GT2 family glycosyltransferase
MANHDYSQEHNAGRRPDGSAGVDAADIDVTVVIKALNEEKNISHAIESSLNALGRLRGEVILADSLSQDATVEIARQYPIGIVQLANAQDRCCGIGPQLGFQYARGEFVYILDGDMELDSEFLERAVRFFRSHPDVAGVAGLVEELGGGNYEFEARKSQGAEWGRPGVQQWLDMGGLYRRSALMEVGYFSNRNLHACEEQDLGMRLTQLGHRLVRLPIRSVRHYGHRESSWNLMKRRFKSRYSDGPGELVRASIGTPVFWRALKGHDKLVAMAGLWSFAAVGIVVLPWTPWPLLIATGTLAALALALVIRKRSASQALLGLLNWKLRTAGFIRGLFSPQVSPRSPIDATVIAKAAVNERIPEKRTQFSKSEETN